MSEVKNMGRGVAEAVKREADMRDSIVAATGGRIYLLDNTASRLHLAVPSFGRLFADGEADRERMGRLLERAINGTS